MNWVDAAKKDIGQSETLGPNDSPWIRSMLANMGASWLVGQPWCGGAMAKWMKSCGLEPPKAWYRAKAWADWGAPLYGPAQGCVVVFSRTGGGHVGIVVGETDTGKLLVLGGNQGDQVKISAFDRSRVTAYRWPPVADVPNYQLAKGDAAMSTSEA